MTATIIGITICALLIAGIIFMTRSEYNHGQTDEKAKNLETIIKKHAESVERQKEVDRICRPWRARAAQWMRSRTTKTGLN